ncbi:MAG: 50S ribosomal protein L3 [Mariniblastus sp.]|nr:50S ribosomal protein L3 [Mariniblastus sp.]
MSKGILGRKVGMTQLFDPDTGIVTPVTVIEAGPCHVTQLRTEEKDGYSAVQLGFLDKKRPSKERRSRGAQASRAERGHVASLKSNRSQKRSEAGIELLPKPGCEPKKFVRELRGDASSYELGQEVKVDSLAEVGRVDVVGTSKGRGFAGVMKRHNFSGQRATHGVKKCHRHAGGTGMSATPSRLFKGKRMAGQYGGKQITSRNLKLVQVDLENNLLMVAGAVPGPNGGFVVVKETNKVG